MLEGHKCLRIRLFTCKISQICYRSVPNPVPDPSVVFGGIFLEIETSDADCGTGSGSGSPNFGGIGAVSDPD